MRTQTVKSLHRVSWDHHIQDGRSEGSRKPRHGTETRSTYDIKIESPFTCSPVLRKILSYFVIIQIVEWIAWLFWKYLSDSRGDRWIGDSSRIKANCSSGRVISSWRSDRPFKVFSLVLGIPKTCSPVQCRLKALIESLIWPSSDNGSEIWPDVKLVSAF